MSWMPSTVSRSSSKRRALLPRTTPVLNDYSGPADGDYARYVEELMAQAQQPQPEVQRTAPAPMPAAAPHATPDAAWGRANAPAASQPVGRSTQRGKQAAYDPLQKNQGVAAVGQPPMPGGALLPSRKASSDAPPHKPGGMAFVLFFMAAAVLMFARPEALPILIMGWVAWQVWRQIKGR